MVLAPVKYGWHAEHVLTVISFFVERVWMTLPHAHVIVASSYLGWMSLFMVLFSLSKLDAYYTISSATIASTPECWYNTRMNLTDLAHGMKIFAGLSPREIDDILYRHNAVKKLYRKGEIIVHAGMEADRLMVVASGRLHVYSDTTDDQHILVREICKDEVLGLWILHLPEVAYWPATVVAAANSVLISFSMESARRLLSSNEPTAARLSANSAQVIARELLSTWRKLMVMDAPNIEKKVMAYLAELDNESGSTGEVVVPFNRERMSEYLGVTRPALSRAIGQLRDRGILSWRKNVFKLKKPGAAS